GTGGWGVRVDGWAGWWRRRLSLGGAGAALASVTTVSWAGRLLRPCASEIDAASVLFPVPVARGIGTFAASGFGRGDGRRSVARGALGSGLRRRFAYDDGVWHVPEFTSRSPHWTSLRPPRAPFSPSPATPCSPSRGATRSRSPRPSA